MTKSSATTVTKYLKELPDDKRKAISDVRKVISANLPNGYEEQVVGGMIMYCIPLEKYPKTYNKQPLCYAGLAAQKNYNALYLMSAYGHAEHAKALQEGFKAAGKKLDMGKSCIRFKTADDLELDLIGNLIASIPPKKWIQIYEASRKRP